MAQLEKAWGYQGDNMNLPVANVAASVPFYETMGFTVVSRRDTPPGSALLARDRVQMQIVENGGDPTQDGCAFRVTDVESLFAEFQGRGVIKETSALKIEHRDGVPWTVFFVVAPDGLCYWFGERQSAPPG
jgi:catechol 2,3-dioxygenase-like lactoylglutathione lyase family enzyme